MLVSLLVLLFRLIFFAKCHAVALGSFGALLLLVLLPKGFHLCTVGASLLEADLDFVLP